MAKKYRSKSVSDIKGQLDRIAGLYQANPTDANFERLNTAMEKGRSYTNNIVRTIGLPYSQFTEQTKQLRVPQPAYMGKSAFSSVREKVINVAPANVGG